MTSATPRETGLRARDTVRFLRRRHQERLRRLAEQSPRAIAARLVERARREARGEPELIRLATDASLCGAWVLLQPSRGMMATCTPAG